MTDPADIAKVLTPADGVYVRQAIDNMGWIDMGDHAIVVDALEQPELEGEVFSAIGDTLGNRPVRYVINTHTHYDHVALNEAFARRGAQIVNAQTAGLSSPADTAAAGPALVRSFEGGGRCVEMLHMPDCHTPEDCIVWVQPQRILFIGDIFGWGIIPLVTNLRQANAVHLVETYRRLIAYEPTVVVGGHGPLLSVAELARWVEYFRWLIEQVTIAVSAGRSDEEILQQIAPPNDMVHWWRFVQWKHMDTLSKVLKSVRRGWLTPL